MEQIFERGMMINSSQKLLTDFASAIDAAIQRGVRETLLRHKRAGNSVAVWQDERVVILEPEQILYEEECGRDEPVKLESTIKDCGAT